MLVGWDWIVTFPQHLILKCIPQRCAFKPLIIVLDSHHYFIKDIRFILITTGLALISYIISSTIIFAAGKILEE